MGSPIRLSKDGIWFNRKKELKNLRSALFVPAAKPAKPATFLEFVQTHCPWLPTTTPENDIRAAYQSQRPTKKQAEALGIGKKQVNRLIKTIRLWNLQHGIADPVELVEEKRLSKKELKRFNRALRKSTTATTLATVPAPTPATPVVPLKLTTMEQFLMDEMKFRQQQR